jgi:hypothetical protein
MNGRESAPRSIRWTDFCRRTFFLQMQNYKTNENGASKQGAKKSPLFVQRQQPFNAVTPRELYTGDITRVQS